MSGSFRNSCDVFRLPLFIQHFLNSIFTWQISRDQNMHVFIQIYKSRDWTLLSGWNSAIESKLFLYFVWALRPQGWLAWRRDWWGTKPRQCLSMWLNFLIDDLGWNSVSFSLMQLRCTCIVVHLYLNNRKQLRCIHTSLACEDSAPQWETSFETVSVCIVYRVTCI